jgi:hypothetical protein
MYQAAINVAVVNIFLTYDKHTYAKIPSTALAAEAFPIMCQFLINSDYFELLFYNRWNNQSRNKHLPRSADKAKKSKKSHRGEGCLSSPSPAPRGRRARSRSPQAQTVKRQRLSPAPGGVAANKKYSETAPPNPLAHLIGTQQLVVSNGCLIADGVVVAYEGLLGGFQVPPDHVAVFVLSVFRPDHETPQYPGPSTRYSKGVVSWAAVKTLRATKGMLPTDGNCHDAHSVPAFVILQSVRLKFAFCVHVAARAVEEIEAKRDSQKRVDRNMVDQLWEDVFLTCIALDFDMKALDYQELPSSGVLRALLDLLKVLPTVRLCLS